MNEQKIVTETIVKLDFIDTLKCLFGRCLKIKTTVWLPYEEEIKSYNAFSDVNIEKTTTHFVKQDRPGFGYMAKEKE